MTNINIGNKIRQLKKRKALLKNRLLLYFPFPRKQ